MAFRSFRTRLRAFQKVRGNPPDPGFIADLEFLENRDLDLSVRLGAMLAFNALLITIGTHPVSASPGAPLSLDAASQPVMTLASLVALLPIAVSSWFVLRAPCLGPSPSSSRRCITPAIWTRFPVPGRKRRLSP